VRILVTGGAGFLGHNLCPRLLAAGWQVRSMDKLTYDYPDRNSYEHVVGDIRSPETVKASLSGVDAVVHCAAALPREPTNVIQSTNVGGTRLLLDLAAAAGVKHFVFISSTAVYGTPKNIPIREDAPLYPLGEYGIAKVAAEELCRAASIPTTIIRPKSFLGRGRLGIFDVVFDWVYSGRHIPLPGGGNNRYQLLDVSDLCESIVNCLIDPENARDTFNIGATEYETLAKDLQYVLNFAGQGRRILNLPAAPVIFALRALDHLKLSPIYPWVFETVTKDSSVSVERAQNRLRWTPKVSNKESLMQTYLSYVAERETNSLGFGSGHRARWNQGVLGLAKYFF
jgi:nucleoside-diphosphate-sugar epimerase